MDDIGNWSETIAPQSLVAEGFVMAISALVIAVYFRRGVTATPVDPFEGSGSGSGAVRSHLLI